jgi:hypothetical protein
MPRKFVLVVVGTTAFMGACGDSSTEMTTAPVTPPPSLAPSVNATAPAISVATTVISTVGRLRALASPPNALRDPSAVWSGESLFAWFGNGAALYTPGTDTWSALPTPGLSPRTDAIVGWSASMLVVWGGSDSNGARFDPTIGAWRPMAPAPIPARTRTWSAYASSDHELYIWGGVNVDGSIAADGAAYDPAADRWRLLPAAPIEGRAYASAVWSGRELILWGGTTTPAGNSGGRGDGAAYNPATNSWRRLAQSPLSAGITSGLWNGSEVLYGPTRSGNANGMFASTTAATYDPSTDTWRRLDLRIGHPGFLSGWDGQHLLLFAKGGGIAVDLRTGSHSEIAQDQDVPTSGAIVSTGTHVLLLGDGKLIEYKP